MAQPTRYVPSYDFSDWQAVHPSDPLPGDQVDAQFNALKTTTDQICNNLALIQRDDGALANLSVGIDQLKAEVSFGFNTLADWVTAHNYVVRDGVYQGNKVYVCLISHLSDTFATDLAAGKWQLIADYNQFIVQAQTYATNAQNSATAAAASAVTATLSTLLTPSTDATTGRALVIGDAGTHIDWTNAGAITVTVPTNASVAFNLGTQIALRQGNTGQITVTPAGGVTINSKFSRLKSEAQFAELFLIKIATNTWQLTGDLVP